MPRPSTPNVVASNREAGDETTSPMIVGLIWAVLWIGSVGVAGPWTGFHGLLFGVTGVLMLAFRPSEKTPKTWIALVTLVAIFSSLSLLPAAWFGIPDWRRHLESIGLQTGKQVAIQSAMAAEFLICFVLMLVGLVWITRFRVSPAQLRLWAFMFILGVAAYALMSRPTLPAGEAGVAAHFGFYPNRNHSATYLAMGSICGMGLILQSLRDKRIVLVAASMLATSLCIWALISWSISRSGIVLISVGLILWLSMLGPRYLGRHGLWVVALIMLCSIGLFLNIDSDVRERLGATVEKAGDLLSLEQRSSQQLEVGTSQESVDFRIPTFIDTVEMIRDQPWTGVGVGQFYYVFPQYRIETVTANDADSFHPESDWLWMAAETGLLATSAMVILVLIAFFRAWRSVIAGRDRALRGACLVAALIVPFHGSFDVPGHRITLAWAAAWLFMLALRKEDSSHEERLTARWTSRFPAILFLAASAFLIRGQWFDGPLPANIRADAAIGEVRRLYEEDLAAQKAALEQGVAFEPDPASDKLEEALRILENAIGEMPLDRRLYRLQASLALQFDDKHEIANRASRLFINLDPAWIEGPLLQADIWSHARPDMTLEFWREAMNRARRVEQKQPLSRWNTDGTLQLIRSRAAGKKDLLPLLQQLE